MSQITLDLHFTDALGRDHVVRAIAIDGSGWLLRTPADGGHFGKHCSDWQSVERSLNWLRIHSHERRVEPEPAKHRSPLLAALVALTLVAGAAAASAQAADPADQPVRAFETATRDYAVMHRRLEQQIGPFDLNTPIDEINRVINELAAAIRTERAEAKQGDLFTPALARELRARVHDSLRAHDFSAADVLNASHVDGIDYGRVALKVNGTFPWALGVSMLPCVIEALPAVPPELQYRFVGADLLLIDVHASVIVDILPSALADYTVR